MTWRKTWRGDGGRLKRVHQTEHGRTLAVNLRSGQVWSRLQLKYNSLALELDYEEDRTTSLVFLYNYLFNILFILLFLLTFKY